MTRRIPIAAALLLAVAGCGGAELVGGNESVTIHTTRIAGLSDLLRMQLETHVEAIDAAPDLEAVDAQEAHFATVAGQTIGALDEELDDLGECSDPAGNPPDTGDLAKLVDGAHELTAAHGPQMEDADTLPDALADEVVYQAQMAPIPGALIDAAASLATKSDVTCPADSDGDEHVAAQAATSSSGSIDPPLHSGGCDCGRPPDPFPRATAALPVLPLLVVAGVWLSRRAGG